jgi:hypothetical protein
LEEDGEGDAARLLSLRLAVGLEVLGDSTGGSDFRELLRGPGETDSSFPLCSCDKAYWARSNLPLKLGEVADGVTELSDSSFLTCPSRVSSILLRASHKLNQECWSVEWSNTSWN